MSGRYGASTSPATPRPYIVESPIPNMGVISYEALWIPSWPVTQLSAFVCLDVRGRGAMPIDPHVLEWFDCMENLSWAGFVGDMFPSTRNTQEYELVC